MLYICLLVILFLSYAGKFRGTVNGLLLLVKDLPGIVNVLVVLTSKRRRLA